LGPDVTVESKKPSLGDVIGLGDVDEDEDMGEEDGSYSAAVSELAEVLGVGDDQMDAFKTAFQAAVMSCK
jgi:hypothetical protein